MAVVPVDADETPLDAQPPRPRRRRRNSGKDVTDGVEATPLEGTDDTKKRKRPKKSRDAQSVEEEEKEATRVVESHERDDDGVNGSSEAADDKSAKQREKRARQGREETEVLGDDQAASSPVRAQRHLRQEEPAVEAETSERGAADRDGETDEHAQDEETPLSNKERRRRKKLERRKSLGLPLMSASAGEEDAASKHGAAAPTTTRTTTTTTTKPQVQRSRYSLWVGNLSFRTNAKRLEEWLEEKGVEGISRVYMPKGARRDEFNKGFAYVDVPDGATVEQGVSLSESHLDGRRLLIKSGSDFDGRPSLSTSTLVRAGLLPSDPASKASSSDPGVGAGASTTSSSVASLLTRTAEKVLRRQKHAPAPTLFVGNLGFEATVEKLRQLLERSAARRSESLVARSTTKAMTRGAREGTERSGATTDERTAAADSGAAEADGPSAEESHDQASGSGQKPRGRSNDGDRPIVGAGIRKIRLGEFEDSGKCKGFGFVDFHTVEHATAALLDPANVRLEGRELVWQYAGADAVRRGAVKRRANDEAEGAGGGGGGLGGAARRPAREQAGGGGKPRRGEEADGDVDVEAEARGKRRRRGADDQEHEGGREELSEAPTSVAPEPGTFDPDAPLPKRHKETQEERRARRAAAGGRGGGERKGQPGGGAGAGAGKAARRAKPGEALANAPRGPTAIVPDQFKGKKTTFD